MLHHKICFSNSGEICTREKNDQERRIAFSGKVCLATAWTISGLLKNR